MERAFARRSGLARRLLRLRLGAGSGSTNSYYTLDALGSVIALTNATGTTDTATYTYDAYGQTLTATGTQATLNPYRYATGYHDTTTGLTKLGTRYYDPTLGRFTQRDPLTHRFRLARCRDLRESHMPSYGMGTLL